MFLRRGIDINAQTQEQPASDGGGQIVALVPDVFFSVTVRNAIRSLGHEAVIVSTVERLASVAADASTALAIVDMTAVRDDDGWAAIGALDAGGLPVLVFGPHRDVDSFRSAKGAGVTRVVANSQFHREMPDLISRYVRAVAPGFDAGDATSPG